MLNNYLKIIFIIGFLSASIPSSAYDVEIDGIFYLLNNSDGTAEVTYGNSNTNSYKGDIVIPESIHYVNDYVVNKIGDYAFCWCNELTSVILPKTIKSIGERSFDLAYNLRAIEFPENLERIGSSFGGCTGLTSIYIPERVKQIGDGAFRDCHNLISIIVSPLNKTYESTNNCNAIIQKSNMTLLYGCNNSNIPEGVKAIGSGAFYNCNELNNIDFPNSLLSINSEAFYGCGKLIDVHIPSNVTYIASNAFCNCENLKKISVNGNNAYYDSRNNCNAIVKKSNNSLLLGCANTVIPNDIKKIEDYAFRSCKGIKHIVLPATITSIGEHAFEECSNLSLVESKIQTPFNIGSLNGTTFRGISSEAVLKVPSGTKNSYLQYTNWVKYFKNVVEDVNTFDIILVAIGNGSVSYNNTTIKNTTQSYTVEEGSSATVTLSPDNGYRIASVKVNNTDVTSSVVNNQYTISNITANTTVEVEFEAIPPTTYSLSITVSGNGSVSYNGTTIRSKKASFTANEGTSVSISITPDNGYRVKSVKENNTDVTSYVSNGKYSITSISRDTNIEVEFEAIPPTTYSLSITASGNGSVSHNGTTIKNDTQSFTVNEGSSATVIFSPDNDYRIASVKVNNTDVTSSVTNNQYTISSISANTTLSVTFEAINGDIFTSKTIEGIDMVFKIISESEKTCQVGRVDGIWESQCNSIPVEYEGDITIPEDANGYHVIGIGRGAFSNCNIKSISIPSDVQYLYREAFSCCYNLQSVVLPIKLQKINGLAFNYCTSLMNIIIPSNVTSIGEYNQEIKGKTNVEIIPVSA